MTIIALLTNNPWKEMKVYNILYHQHHHMKVFLAPMKSLLILMILDDPLPKWFGPLSLNNLLVVQGQLWRFFKEMKTGADPLSCQDIAFHSWFSNAIGNQKDSLHETNININDDGIVRNSIMFHFIYLYWVYCFIRVCNYHTPNLNW